ncbi:MAG TPA: hypothetical protein PLY34_14690 [Ferruginibacter sp.]|nr:hypothetical protein [Ferruginibacter sp.]HPH91531.1 hypothetical protein [Ferruginibacter sp.]
MSNQKLISTFLFLLTTLAYVTVANGQGKSKDSIHCFELKTNLKGYFSRDTADSVEIKYLYSMGEYSMYWNPVNESTVSARFDGSEWIMGDTVYKKWISYRYFIYKNSQEVGREYSSKDENFSMPINVDSLLTIQKVVLVTNLEKYKCAGDSILPNNDLLRTFVPKTSVENGVVDTLYFVYKKCNRHLKFEFLKDIDTIKDYRVVKGTAVHDSFWKEYINDEKRRPFYREIYQELAPVPVQNYDKVYSLFQRFIKDTTQ